MTKRQVKLAVLNGTVDELIEQETVKLIRLKYSANKEAAVSRKREREPEKFAAMDEYIERCVASVKAQIVALGGVLDE